MDETESYITESSAPSLTRMLEYAKRSMRLRHRHPGCVFIKTATELEAALHEYKWGSEQVVDAFPWSYLTFFRTAKKDLSFVLTSQWMKDHYVDLMRGWPATARNARYLYSPAELAEWFRANTTSTIETVLVPLTLFTDKPDAMRRRFKRLKREKMETIYEGGPLAYRNNRRSTWGLTDLVRPNLRAQVGRWFEDVTEKAHQQGVQFHRTKLQTYEVKLPSGLFPKYFTYHEIGATRDYPTKEVGMTTARSFAWCRHEVNNRGVKVLGFTQGIAVGGKEYDQDYESGLLELMTAERFVALFGEDVLKDARWRISKDLTHWARADAPFGPGLPPKYLSALLGINYITGIQVFK